MTATTATPKRPARSRKAATSAPAASTPAAAGRKRSAAEPPIDPAAPVSAWVGTTWLLTVAGKPVAKQRTRSDVRGGGHRTPEATVSFERRVAGAAINAGVTMPEGAAMAVDVVVWLADFREPDGDNVLKAILDGVLRAGRNALPDDSLRYVQDKRVRLGGYDRFNPRVEIRLTLNQRIPRCFVGEGSNDNDLGEIIVPSAEGPPF